MTASRFRAGRAGIWPAWDAAPDAAPWRTRGHQAIEDGVALAAIHRPCRQNIGATRVADLRGLRREAVWPRPAHLADQWSPLMTPRAATWQGGPPACRAIAGARLDLELPRGGRSPGGSCFTLTRGSKSTSLAKPTQAKANRRPEQGRGRIMPITVRRRPAPPPEEIRTTASQIRSLAPPGTITPRIALAGREYAAFIIGRPFARLVGHSASRVWQQPAQHRSPEMDRRRHHTKRRDRAPSAKVLIRLALDVTSRVGTGHRLPPYSIMYAKRGT